MLKKKSLLKRKSLLKKKSLLKEKSLLAHQIQASFERATKVFCQDSHLTLTS